MTEFICETIWSWMLVCWKFLNHSFTTVSISVLVVDLFILYIYSWFSLKNVCLLRIHPFLLCHPFHWHMGFPGATSGKESVCQSRRCKTWVQSLGGKDPLEEGMATQFSILAWKIPWTEEPGGLQSIGSHRIGHNWSNFTYLAGIIGI